MPASGDHKGSRFDVWKILLSQIGAKMVPGVRGGDKWLGGVIISVAGAMMQNTSLKEIAIVIMTVSIVPSLRRLNQRRDGKNFV